MFSAEASKKRRRGDDDDSDEEAGLEASIMRDHAITAEKHARSAQPYHSGESFRAKKAKGDLRGKDQKARTHCVCKYQSCMFSNVVLVLLLRRPLALACDGGLG